MSKENILQKGERTSKRVAFIVALFAIAKATAGFLSGSVVLLSDSLHSAGDVFEILLVWLGFKISQRKPTKKFPYGFYKVENLIALIVSFLILYVGFEIAQESYQRIFTTYTLKIPYIAFGVAILDAVAIYFLGRYEEKIGKEINSQSLIADGRESKLHIFSSSLVVLGILTSYFGIPRIEGVVGILLALLVFKVGLESLKDAGFSLIDVSPSKEIEDKVRNILKSIPRVEEFSNLKLRKSGPFIFGQVTIQVKKFLEVERAHEIAGKIEEKVKKEVAQLESFIIHVEPFKKSEQRIVIPTREDKGFDSSVDEQFGRTNFFAILETKEDKVESLRFLKNPFKEKEIRVGLSVARYLLEENPDILITEEIGPISFHALRDNLIEIYKAEGKNIRETAERFLKNKLVKIEKPTRKKE